MMMSEPIKKSILLNHFSSLLTGNDIFHYNIELNVNYSLSSDILKDEISIKETYKAICKTKPQVVTVNYVIF